MKELCLHVISIHTNFNQNLSINECAKVIFGKKWSWMTFEVILHFMKYLRLYNVYILKKF